MEARDRISGLDGLRGLAALGVALFHFTYQYEEKFGRTPDSSFHFTWGHYGVNLFFMISGFVIFMTLEKVRRPRDFLISRFSRLYPAYWTALLLTFLATHWSDLPGLRTQPLAAAVNLTMLQGFFGIPSVDHSYWTLQVELCFYLALFLLYLGRNLDRVNVFLLADLVLAWVDHGWSGMAWAHADTASVARQLLFLPQVPFFAIGIVCYRLVLRRDFRRVTNYLVLVFALAMMKRLMPWGSFALHLGFCAAVFSVASGRAHWLSLKPLVFLGAVSYPFYLIHQFLGYLILHRFYTLGLNPDLSIFLVLILCLGLSWVIHRWVEKPAQQALRSRFIPRLASPSSPCRGTVR